MSARLAAIALVFSFTLQAATSDELRDQVKKAETAFAKTMADRDLAAFAAFLSREAIFFSQNQALRGPDKITAQWKRYFDGPKAPFSWAPDQVEVLDSGTLAMTSGPVLDPDGKRIGTFHSVWRREGKGRWKIVLDNGCRC